LTKAVLEWNNKLMKWRTTIGYAKGRRWAATLLAGAFSLAYLTAAQACELKVTWKATLTGSPSVPSPATGSAAIDFDFAHPGATLQVDTKNLQDVRAIELHVARSYTDHTGPAVLMLYSSGDGQTPATLIRHMGEADLRKQTAPKVAGFSDVITAVLNGRAYVLVATKAHPEGELSGFIRMHKEEVYSDSAADPAHDAALHHAAQAHPAAPSPTP